MKEIGSVNQVSEQIADSITVLDSGISKTGNLPNEATREDVADTYHPLNDDELCATQRASPYIWRAHATSKC